MRFIFALLFFITACKPAGFDLYQKPQKTLAEEAHLSKVADGTRVFDGDPEPKWPGAAGDKTLEGIDADNDGVRDDLEIWINEYVKDNNLGHHGNLRRAVKQYVRDQTRYILGFEKSKDEVIKLHEQRMRSRECVDYFWFLIPEREQDKNNYSDIVNSKIAATEERHKAYTKVADTLGSHSYGSFGTQPGQRAKFCEFKIEHLQEYIDQFIKIAPDRYKNLKAEDLQ